MTHNLVNLAGHGMTRASMRGFDPSPLSDAEMKEMLGLLSDAMDQGARGVSFGLQYEPGLFATTDEIEQDLRARQGEGQGRHRPLQGLLDPLGHLPDDPPRGAP